MGIASAGGAVLLPPGGGYGRVSGFFDGNQGSSPRLTPFVDELPGTGSSPFETLTPAGAPGAIFPDTQAYARPFCGQTTRCFEIDVVERNVKFHRDLPPTSVWAYVDRLAGNIPDRLISFQYPPIKLGEVPGGGILARVHNSLPTAPRDFGFPNITVHFHGGHQPAAADGFPHDLVNRPADFPNVTIPAGGFHDYMYPFIDVGEFDQPIEEDERASTYWFHDHFLDFTGPNVYRGLANIVPAFDDLDADDENDPHRLRLPSGDYDIPLVLLDKTFDVSGALIFDPFNQDGFLGDTMTVNGVVQPYCHVKRRKYRFRFLDGCNARFFQIFLTNDHAQTFPMTQIATEAGLLGHPIRNLQSFLLHMSQRVEVVVDFGDPIFDGQQAVYFENRMAQSNGRKPDGVTRSGTKLVKFIIDNPGQGRVDDPSTVDDTLRPFAPISAAELSVAEHRSFEFNRSHGVFTINGDPVDLEKPVALVKRDRGQIWTFINKSGGWWHPNHVHSEFMRVLKRNGRTPAANELDGNARKDTILLEGGDTVQVYVKFRDYTGPFVFHCHNLEHEDMAMMGRFDVID
jgi:FtsP/CotA-like multicopper oxidase with cupredoxin domain